MKRSIGIFVLAFQSICLLAQTDLQSIKANRSENSSHNERSTRDAQNKKFTDNNREHITHKGQSAMLVAMKDSIISTNDSFNNQLDSDSLKKGYEQHKHFVNWLNTIYASTTIDKLYKESSKKELLLIKKIYKTLNMNVPLVIEQTIECFDAKEQCAKKYNKVLIDKTVALLLKHNSNTSQELSMKLQQYSAVYAEADSLWTAMKDEVCKEEIVEESFPQIQSKRQIWQRTQKFLNKYPTLTSDYPYIYDELQKMLREIWKNANNFNKIPAPFK
jgi:hypothetical protein